MDESGVDPASYCKLFIAIFVQCLGLTVEKVIDSCTGNKPNRSLIALFVQLVHALLNKTRAQ